MTEQQTDPSATERAGAAADQGKQAASDVAATATDQAQNVAQEAKSQARDLVGEARGEITRQASDQQRNLVGNLRTLSSQLQSMHQGADEQGTATELVGQARGHVDTVADWLDSREPGQVLDDVRNFARRKPGLFLLGAAAAGIAVGRLGRGVAAVHQDDSGTGASGGSIRQPAVRPSPQPAPGAPAPGAHALPDAGHRPVEDGDYSAPSYSAGASTVSAPADPVIPAVPPVPPVGEPYPGSGR